MNLHTGRYFRWRSILLPLLLPVDQPTIETRRTRDKPERTNTMFKHDNVVVIVLRPDYSCLYRVARSAKA
jgi:hypothetical protein